MIDTNLTSTQIAQVTAFVTGGGFKRAATKEAAAKRLAAVLLPYGIDVGDILKAKSFDEATALVERRMGEDVTPSIAEAAAEKTNRSNIAELPTSGGAGLARLQASGKAQALRDEANAETSRALAEAAKSRKAALAVAEQSAPPPAPKKERKASAEPKKAEGSTSRARIETSMEITGVVENPKQKGSRSHARFELYKAGQTVEGFIAACVAAGHKASEAKADISWDRRKGFITIG